MKRASGSDDPPLIGFEQIYQTIYKFAICFHLPLNLVLEQASVQIIQFMSNLFFWTGHFVARRIAIKVLLCEADKNEHNGKPR